MSYGIFNQYANEFWVDDAGKIETFNTAEEAEAEAVKWRGYVDFAESTVREIPTK